MALPIYTEIIISENLILRASKVNHGVAIVCFLDGRYNVINIPDEFEIFDLTNDVINKPLRNTQMYALCWSDNYEFRYKGKPFVQLSLERKWVIKKMSTSEGRNEMKNETSTGRLIIGCGKKGF